MTPVGHHPLVGQLLRSVGASEMEVPTPAVRRKLLGRISQMYYETDQDRDELERSIESSSRAMQRLYQELKQKADSERAEQDAIMRATLESAIEGILVVDNQHGVIAVNRRFAEMARIPGEELATRDRRVLIATALKMAEVITHRIEAGVRLRQILYNLLSNAVKFTDKGGRVRIRARRDNDRVSIAVMDTGIGIAARDLSRLYRSFEQLTLPSGDRPGGTGLGLALTKRLVEMHGGTIDVESELGVGTTFTVRIPVA